MLLLLGGATCRRAQALEQRALLFELVGNKGLQLLELILPVVEATVEVAHLATLPLQRGVGILQGALVAGRALHGQLQVLVRAHLAVRVDVLARHAASTAHLLVRAADGLPLALVVEVVLQVLEAADVLAVRRRARDALRGDELVEHGLRDAGLLIHLGQFHGGSARWAAERPARAVALLLHLDQAVQAVVVVVRAGAARMVERRLADAADELLGRHRVQVVLLVEQVAKM